MRIFLYASFHCVRIIANVIFRTIRWKLNGTYRQIQLSKTVPELYPVSAQVLKVHYRHKFDTIDESPSIGNFITSHQGFVHPEYILQDHVTLYCLHDDLAVFVETDKDVDVTKVEFGAFLRISQYEFAKRLVLLPIISYHYLADQVGEPQCKVILISNTSRCGSTLVCQLFQQTGECVALSEPDPPNTINQLSRKIPHEEVLRITRSTIKLLCKPVTSHAVCAYVIKLSAVSPDAVPLISNACPFIEHLFMYRDGLKVAQSLARAVQGGFAMANLAFSLAKISPRITRAMIEDMGFNTYECKVDSSEPIAWTFFLWAHTIHKYLTWRQQGLNIVAVRYEDLQTDPAHFISSILKHFQLPKTWKKSALDGMCLDSQRHSSISREALSRVPIPELTPKTKMSLCEMCSFYGLPHVGEPCILEATISSRQNAVTINNN